ncbi:MAG: prephenate dehydrogenase/arogenate dehydrogenase family protein [bacterium]|nr:prephenate dehydrogenase/arogenate dehydrogenase family protein [bacterium]
MPRHIKQISICGFGLIGGCMALDFQKGGEKRAPEIVAYDRVGVLRNLKKDRRFRVRAESSFKEAIKNSDVIVLAAPHLANESLLKRLAKTGGLNDCLIVDTGAVKQPIARLAASLKFGPGVQFVASHPMAGRERKGFENSDDRLFLDHVWYLDDSVELNGINRTRLDWMVQRLGVTPAYISPPMHDELVSEISHLPQLISTVLGAQINPDLIELAGPGLRSMLRLSGSPYSVWSEIIDQNREEIIKALDTYADNIATVKKMIEKKKSLQEIFASATRSYKCLS